MLRLHYWQVARVDRPGLHRRKSYLGTRGITLVSTPNYVTFTNDDDCTRTKLQRVGIPVGNLEIVNFPYFV